MYTPGVRVIRGQDWIWGDQDGGLGSSGTVCELGQPGSKRSPDKTVVVCWDCGLRSNYRTGYQGQFDLTVIDNAQCGVRHPNIECDSCKQNGIVGMRYKCTICYDYDLCTPCYHADIHNLDHPFLRYDSPISSGVKLTARLNESKLPVRGIFIGATVQRGHDWKWANQDGGEGSTGAVTDICCWGNESSRSVACVKWRDGTKNDYRVGHKGIMDLKYIAPAAAGSYFTSHLPVLGKIPEATVSRVVPVESGLPAGEAAPRLCPGDRVRVALDADTLRHLQQGHGGWNPRMADYIGKVGVVHRVTERGDIRVQHEGCPNRWTFHPATLVAVAWYRAGDIVRVISELAQARQLQRQHGEWVPAMEMALGKTGRVMNVYSDGDLRIQILDDNVNKMWTLNPQCVNLVQRCPNPDQTVVPPPLPAANAQVFNTPVPNTQVPINQAPSVPVAGPRPSPSPSQPGPSVQGQPLGPASTSPDRPEMRLLMSKVAQGNLEYVKELYETDKSIIDSPYCGKTLLQVAAYQGHRPLVQFLLSKGAKPTAVDDDGDSVLHDAAFGNQPEILEILLSDKDVDINAVNRSCCTALHIAAHKCLPHCVWVLLQHKPNVNLQDTYGDTALHDAINNQCSSTISSSSGSSNGGGGGAAQVAPAGQPTTPLAPPLSGSMRIIQMLCDYPDTNFSLANKRGFNALQHAALKGNAFACAAICRRAPSLVDRPKDDGFSALHLAALNGHAQAVSALVTIGRADLNLRNNRHQSPLLLSISQGHCIVIEQLISLGCLATAFDEDGNTALHIAHMKRLNAQSSEAQKPNNKDCPGIFAIYDKLSSNEVGANRVTFSIIIFLIQKGCDPKAKNNEGKCVFDLIGTSAAGGKKLEDLLPSFLSPTEGQASTVPSSETAVDLLELANRHLANVTISSDSASDAARATTSSPTVTVPEMPNSSQEGAFGGANVGINVNASPSKRNYYNLLNYADLAGECSSSNSSPVHYGNMMNRGTPGKTNNTSSPQHPVRPSRHKKSASPPSNPGTPPRTKPTECVVCCELSEANSLLEPCGHRPACEDCSARMKKCLTCGIIIERRLTTDGRIIPCRSRQPSAEHLRYLECKIQEIEEAHCCPICLERRRTVAFLCGHGACSKCAATLSTCHMCRQDITSKINLY